VHTFNCVWYYMKMPIKPIFHGTTRGVARNLIWVGINCTISNLSWVKETKQPHTKIFKVDWFGGYIHRYTPRPPSLCPCVQQHRQFHNKNTPRVFKIPTAMWNKQEYIPTLMLILLSQLETFKFCISITNVCCRINRNRQRYHRLFKTYTIHHARHLS